MCGIGKVVQGLGYISSCSFSHFFINKPITYLRNDIDTPATGYKKPIKFLKEEALTRIIGIFASLTLALDILKITGIIGCTGVILLGRKITRCDAIKEINDTDFRGVSTFIVKKLLPKIFYKSLEGFVFPDNFAQGPKNFYYLKSIPECYKDHKDSILSFLLETIKIQRTDKNKIIGEYNRPSYIFSPSELTVLKKFAKKEFVFEGCVILELNLPYTQWNEASKEWGDVVEVKITPQNLRSITGPQYVKDVWDTYIQGLDASLKTKEDEAERVFRGQQRPTAKFEAYEIDDVRESDPEARVLRTKIAGLKKVKFVVES